MFNSIFSSIRLRGWSKHKATWFALIFSAYLVKLILMPITSHNDLLQIAWKSHHITRSNWNIYEHMGELYGDYESVTNHPPAPYPYLSYAVTALWLELLSAVGLINYQDWTTIWSAITNRSVWFFSLKLLYLMADLAIGILLCKSASGGRGLMAWAGWAWSPSAMYLLFMGQNDLYPALFITLAMFWGAHALSVQRANASSYISLIYSILAMLALGVGALFKLFPLMLAPLFALVLGVQFRRQAVLIAIATAVFALGALPFFGTPAFIKGVIFNFEGVRVFSQINIFSNPSSLFVVTYVILIVLLFALPRSFMQPVTLWCIGVALFSSLFLFSWSQFYWAVWLTPLLVALVALDTRRARYWIATWLILEISFIVVLFIELHRDFGFGLLANASPSFRFAQLDAAVALFLSDARNILDILRSIAISAQTAARLVLLSVSISALLMPRLVGQGGANAIRKTLSYQRWRFLFLVPVVIGCLFALLVLFVLRHAVVHQYGHNRAQRVVLTVEQPYFEQFLPALDETLTGLLLMAMPSESANPPSSLQFCIYTITSQVCEYGYLVQTKLFYGYALRFSSPLSIGNQPMRITVQLGETSSNVRLSLPVALLPEVRQPEDYQLRQGQLLLTGHTARFSLLRTFDVERAMTELVERLTQDWRLIALWLFIALLVSIIIYRAVRVTKDGL